MLLLRLYHITEARSSWIRSSDVYHITVCNRIEEYLSEGQRFTLRPSVPEMVEWGEDKTTPRISFCRTIEEALRVLPMGIFGGEQFYAFKPAVPVLLHVTARADHRFPDDRHFRSGVGGREELNQDELWAFDPVESIVAGIFEYSYDGKHQRVK